MLRGEIKMVDHLMDVDLVEDGEPSSFPKGIPAEQLSPVSLLSNPLCCEMSLPVLAAQCLRELDHSRRGEPCHGTGERQISKGVPRPVVHAM